MAKYIIAVSGLEDEGVRTWKDLGLRRTYQLWKDRIVRQPDGSYIVDSLSDPDTKYHIPFHLSSCPCKAYEYAKPDDSDSKPSCIHMQLATMRDVALRREDAKRAEKAREEALGRGRMRFSPEQVWANLERMSEGGAV